MNHDIDSRLLVFEMVYKELFKQLQFVSWYIIKQKTSYSG